MSQSSRMKADKKAKVKVDAMIEEKVDAIKRRRLTPDSLPCTAEDVVRERDEKGLSWAQVAANLGLGNPSAARKAYTLLTGKPHSSSNPIINRSSGGGWKGRKATHSPLWDDDSDQDEIIEMVTGRVIFVVRDYKGTKWEEEMFVDRVAAFSFGKDGDQPLTMEFYDRGLYDDQGRLVCSGPCRVVSVSTIKEIR